MKKMLGEFGTMINFEANDVIPALKDMLNGCKVIQVYSGKDHNCRCGCGGRYYEMEFECDHSTIKRLLTKANTFLHKHPEECELFIPSKESHLEHWLNIPTGFCGAGRAITIYFKGNPNF